ncbi:hypothetical protein Golob_005573 [Gossypium lobatum]|uniref:Vacuolar protein sorting-associated protein 32 homolog 2-like n=1 Tax=Gossypium lobatum TaxID=34289 RepID=A0A7J8MTL6_9ROSI|nr:hypothetical protein [Gossypium lobatum]
MIMLEGAKATTETVDALRTGAAAMKAMQKATYVFYIFLLLDKNFPLGFSSLYLSLCRMITISLKFAGLQFMLIYISTYLHEEQAVVNSKCYTENGFLCRNIDDVDKTMDEINEQTENMKQIQEALSTPIGAAADFDEDELEAELEELEGAELEEQLLQPATTAPAAPVQVPAGRQPARPIPQKRTAEEDELAALQAEMAL